MEETYDIVVVGGGLVGSACALALAGAGFKLAVIDKVAPQQLEALPATRVSALNAASQQFLAQLGVWALLDPARLTEILAVEVFREQAALDFNAAEFALTELGFIVENDLVQTALWEQLQQKKVAQLCPFGIGRLERLEHGWRIELEETGNTVTSLRKKTLAAKLLIIAEGKHSKLREYLKVPVQTRFYGQKALVANFNTSIPHRLKAVQRFLDTGPIAFLPLFKPNWISMVWTLPEGDAERYLHLSPTELCSEVAHAMPDFGALECLNRPAVFELSAVSAVHYCGAGFALIGDAAHAVHPLAGQGLNLGLRDAMVLAKVLTEAFTEASDFSALRVLKVYEAKCKFKNEVFSQGFSWLNRGGSIQHSGFNKALTFGLKSIQRVHGLKRELIKIARGTPWRS